MGMVILYGGAQIEGNGFYVDLWHFVVKGNEIIFKQIENSVEGDNLFMTWRHGFTMHHVRGEQDPILIGGTYGNNQQSQALVTLPEQKCKNMDDLYKGTWSPWPYGSSYKDGTWKWCDHDEYFNGYLWKTWPLGLVGGNFGVCVPCPGGYIYDLNYPSFCRQCTEDEICPMATRYAFPVTDFDKNFEEVRLDSYPELFNPHAKKFDYVSAIVIFLLLCLSLVLATLIAILLTVYKEKSLFVFREIDITFLTGGKRKVIGGILILFYFLIITLIILGFLLNFLFFNREVEIFETKNPYLNKVYPSSYIFKINLYASNFMREQSSVSTYDGSLTKIFDAPTPDLCKEHRISVSLSRYFSQAEEKNKQFSCTKKTLGNGTDEYTIELKISNIQDEAPENAFVRFEADSDFEQVFHFFKWEYWNIWSFVYSVPGSYSKLSGFMTPQMLTRSNKNITSAFRGPQTNKIHYKLVPTHYGDQIQSTNFEGYQVFLDKYDRGSVVSKRNIQVEKTIKGEPSKGIVIEMFSSTASTINHVRVTRSVTILELLAYIFGIPAGIALLIHVIKYFLAKEEYFRALDRECDAMFGRIETDRDERSNQLSRVEQFQQNHELRRIEDSLSNPKEEVKGEQL